MKGLLDVRRGLIIFLRRFQAVLQQTDLFFLIFYFILKHIYNQCTYVKYQLPFVEPQGRTATLSALHNVILFSSIHGASSRRLVSGR